MEKSSETRKIPKLRDEDIMATFDRDTRRAEEFNRLVEIFTDLEEHKFQVAVGICEELASIKVEMLVVKAEYESRGSVDEMSQGEYSVLRVSPYFQNYLSLAKLYSSLLKQILDMYPKDTSKVEVTNELDELQSFFKKWN